jgi:hypothetical protein
MDQNDNLKTFIRTPVFAHSTARLEAMCRTAVTILHVNLFPKRGSSFPHLLSMHCTAFASSIMRITPTQLARCSLADNSQSRMFL